VFGFAEVNLTFKIAAEVLGAIVVGAVYAAAQYGTTLKTPALVL
jgi:hypothetical protein